MKKRKPYPQIVAGTKPTNSRAHPVRAILKAAEGNEVALRKALEPLDVVINGSLRRTLGALPGPILRGILAIVTAPPTKGKGHA